ncbi:MAG: glycoside hydrolase family 2 protein [Chitinophaga sp.]|uniref:glycoside hydrolase family 2 protein n=1 Tax=Chitinophaga sp. TaxID=1869181 RepID=UPI0025C4B70B|nr:glycoside hydrolase family 2 TIM barrel-domain containing protein [Chitinophaga sp.]MBV8256036.1 glycoside hydrolase family 2 protein [Chitinophaga sp.]
MRAFLLTIFLLTGACCGFAQQARQRIPINDGWTFRFAYDVRKNAPVQHVQLPHTWNASDVAAGKMDYYRTTGIYTRKIHLEPAWKGRRIFLFMEGANAVAEVYVNQKLVTEHKGGYTAFCTEITGYLQEGGDSQLSIQVSNAYRNDVLPLSGDFNVYGGIHRPVSLIVTGPDCITPLDYASPGVYIQQQHVSAYEAQVQVTTKLSLKRATDLQLRTIITDAQQKQVATLTTTVGQDSIIRQPLTMQHPHLWNGRKDPYLYKVTVQLMQNGNVLDEIVQPLGLRYYGVDPDKGFSLNGVNTDLHGFGLHEDVAGKGSAMDHQDQQKDMQLIMEVGANAMRLTHYPHSNYFYELADTNGIILWTEIPLVGPGGYNGAGYVNSNGLRQQARQVLTELIRQQYNHPSICFWGLFNELKLDYDDPIPFVDTLNQLAKSEDPTRLTTCASFLDNGKFNQSSDVIAWNKYFGWYGGRFEEMGTWADSLHHLFPRKPIAISEYGAGANIGQHTEVLQAPDPGGPFHPEEWQTAYHEKNWEELSRRPFIWGKFVWVLCDFGSAIREEGSVKALNDKGLVTYDRSMRKDAFYFYKANWSNEPVLYIAERRNNIRKQEKANIKVFTNANAVELFVNGKSMGKATTDAFKRATWPQVPLQPGENLISVRAIRNGQVLNDNCTWQRSDNATTLSR